MKAIKPNTATPSLRATPSEEGERIPNAENSPSFEGVPEGWGSRILLFLLS